MVAQKKARVKPSRVCRLEHVGAETVLTMTLTYPRHVEVYRYLLRELTGCAFGRGYTLLKIEGEGDAEAVSEVYHINLNGRESVCGCKGFEKWGLACDQGRGCKHLAALRCLVEAGRLPVTTQAEPPAASAPAAPAAVLAVA